MERKKYVRKTARLAFAALLPLFLICSCYTPPKNRSSGDREVVVNAPFRAVNEAVVRAMAEKNILVSTDESASRVEFSGNLLVDVEQYADCGKYSGKRIAGYADMNFIIALHRMRNDHTGIQVTSTVEIPAPDLAIATGGSFECISNGRVEDELLDAVMKKLR